MTTTRVDSKGRPIGFTEPPVTVEEPPIERAPYVRRSTESSQLLAALGHPIRIAVLLHMKTGQDAAPADLTQIASIQVLDTEVANVSHHVKKLSQAGLVKPTRIVRGNRALKQMYEITERGMLMARVCEMAEKMLKAGSE